LCFELILRLLFVVYTSLYRCAHAGIRIERGSAVDLATTRNIKLWNSVREGDDQLRRRTIIENEINILSS